MSDAEHAWSGALLIRDSRGVYEEEPPGQQWTEVMAGTQLTGPHSLIGCVSSRY